MVHVNKKKEGRYQKVAGFTNSLVGTKHYLLDGMLNQTLHNRLPCVSTMSCSVSVVYRAGLDTAVQCVQCTVCTEQAVLYRLLARLATSSTQHSVPPWLHP